jgi:hypothetical protein
MEVIMPSIKSFDITLGDINFLLEQLRHTIQVVGYDSEGRALYGFTDSSGVTHALGLFGAFDPLAVTDPTTNLPIYGGARDPSGLRVLDGFFNNLTGTVSAPGAWTWGAVDNPFPRLAAADSLRRRRWRGIEDL